MAGVPDIIVCWVLIPYLSVSCTDSLHKHSACTVEVEGIGPKKGRCYLHHNTLSSEFRRVCHFSEHSEQCILEQLRGAGIS